MFVVLRFAHFELVVFVFSMNARAGHAAKKEVSTIVYFEHDGTCRRLKHATAQHPVDLLRTILLESISP